MAIVNQLSMALPPAKLNAMDEWILDYMGDHKRATPNLLLHLYNDEQDDADDSISRQWVSSRINRLTEHGHLQRVHPDDSTYEFVSDPRDPREDTDEA
jgi:hypothetical protein